KAKTVELEELPSLEAKQRERDELARAMEEYLARGGRVQEVEPNVVADPPKKPDSKYGSRPIRSSEVGRRARRLEASPVALQASSQGAQHQLAAGLFRVRSVGYSAVLTTNRQRPNEFGPTACASCRAAPAAPPDCR